MPNVTLPGLLARGYLTEELPPPFTSSSFATAVATNEGTLPTEFTEPGQPFTKPVRHHLVRPGNLPRRFSIPNPTAAAVVARIVAECWEDLTEVHRKSRYSMSRPVPSDKPEHRALIWSHTGSQQDIRRAEVRVGVRYVVRADVSLFYPSLYTHALPWALHGKSIAKQYQRDMTLLGNRLDQALRRGQDGQTIGVPIGPSWSLALSELVTSRVDEVLQQENPDLECMRTVDDYEFGAYSEDLAEQILATLRSQLASFELQLNATKTTVRRVPLQIMPSWKAALRGFTIRWRNQASDLIRYFDLAASLGQATDTAAPLSWATNRMRRLKLRGSNWPLVHDLLLQAVMIEPGCTKNAMRSLLEHRREGLPLNEDAVRRTLSSVIERHAPLGSSSEVAWALWAAIAFGLQLDKRVGEFLSDMPDSVVGLLALDAERRGLLDGLDTAYWSTLLNADELRSDQWLLAYEAAKKGWLGNKQHITAVSEFAALDTWDVEFYDSDSRLAAVPPITEPLVPPPEDGGKAVDEEEGAATARPRVLDLFDVPTAVESDEDDDESYAR